MLEFIRNNLVPSTWCVAGILLALSELMVPGFFIVFFGAAALLVGVFLYFVPDFPLTGVAILYLALSLGLLFGSRKLFPKTFHGNTSREKGDPDEDQVRGARAVVTEAIPPDRVGRVEFRGSQWNATADAPIPAGADVIVERRDNLTLHVRPL